MSQDLRSNYKECAISLGICDNEDFNYVVPTTYSKVMLATIIEQERWPGDPTLTPHWKRCGTIIIILIIIWKSDIEKNLTITIGV